MERGFFGAGRELTERPVPPESDFMENAHVSLPLPTPKRGHVLLDDIQQVAGDGYDL